MEIVIYHMFKLLHLHAKLKNLLANFVYNFWNVYVLHKYYTLISGYLVPIPYSSAFDVPKLSVTYLGYKTPKR